VTCLVRTPAKAAARGWTGVRLVTGGLDDAAALREACTGAEVIYHLAGLISARNLTEFMATNRDRTGELVDTARAVAPAARFVYVSTLAAGGPTVAGRPIDEQRPPAPVTDYGRSKLAGEVLVRSEERRGGKDGEAQV